MPRPTRVLQVVTIMDQGGLENFIMNIYRNIDTSELQFDFLVHRDKQGAFDAEINQMGGRIHSVPRANPLSQAYRSSLREFFTNYEYPVVHSHIDCLSALPLYFARESGRSSVRIAHSHSMKEDINYKLPIKLVAKQFIPAVATDLCAASVSAGKWMFGNYKFEVFKNAIDLNRYGYSNAVRASVRQELGIPPQVSVVGHVGRFTKQKNHSRVLTTFKKYLSIDSSAVLLLVGDGELKSDIEAQAKHLELLNNVQFLGTRTDIPRLMQSMDVLLFPSISEGLGIVLIEAQASGLPCLISTCIPEEVDVISELITRASLAENDELWAHKLHKIIRSKNDRHESHINRLRHAGYDAKEQAQYLSKYYICAIERS